ncbi:MAG: tripartite tricarboxylate transporter substrate binding protein [Desulfovibrio sp.]|uniref:tripartite tricarboxylate transporter substrate binding protein n=1 Tax=Desulfovibrio sp. 7SRBS1 TaxID=3378064 RepID=UPI003B41C979
MRTMKGFLFVLFFTVSLIASGSSISKAAWPDDKAITMIVSYSPGGSTDVAARMAAVYIEKYLGQSIAVLNKPGAGGEVGFTALSNATPDGYTVGFLNTPNILTIPIQRKTRYSLESFIPVAQLMDDPSAFYVLKDSPYNNLEDLLKAAKEKPGKITYGTSGIGSDDHIAAEMLAQKAGVKLKHIPFNGTSANRTALLGGHVTVGVFNVSEGKEYVETGQVKIIGQMSEKRTELFPNVPTFKEQGYDIVMASIRGIGMPAGTPADIVKRFADATEKAINDPEFIQKCNEAHIPLRYLGPQDFLEVLQMNRSQFRALWDSNPWVKSK